MAERSYIYQYTRNNKQVIKHNDYKDVAIGGYAVHRGIRLSGFWSAEVVLHKTTFANKKTDENQPKTIIHKTSTQKKNFKQLSTLPVSGRIEKPHISHILFHEVSIISKRKMFHILSQLFNPSPLLSIYQ